VPDFPAVDGTVITNKALEAFSKGLFNQVPIMTGLVADEQAYFLSELNTGVPLTPEEFYAIHSDTRCRDTVGLRFNALWKRYQTPLR
jgi:hypothetical protein